MLRFLGNPLQAHALLGLRSLSTITSRKGSVNACIKRRLWMSSVMLSGLHKDDTCFGAWYKRFLDTDLAGELTVWGSSQQTCQR